MHLENYGTLLLTSEPITESTDLTTKSPISHWWYRGQQKIAAATLIRTDGTVLRIQAARIGASCDLALHPYRLPNPNGRYENLECCQ